MIAVVDIAVATLLVVSGFFGLVGSVGLVKFPDTMTRLHAPTKATTLGVGGVLLASMLAYGFRGQPWGHELLVSVFLFITAPISAQFIAKSVIHRSLGRGDLPPTGGPATWSTWDPTCDTGAAELAEQVRDN